MDKSQASVLTVVSGILLAGDHRLGVEQASVGSRSDFVDDVGLQVDVERSGDVLAGAGLGEESREAVVIGAGLIHQSTIGLHISVFAR